MQRLGKKMINWIKNLFSNTVQCCFSHINKKDVECRWVKFLDAQGKVQYISEVGVLELVHQLKKTQKPKKNVIAKIGPKMPSWDELQQRMEKLKGIN